MLFQMTSLKSGEQKPTWAHAEGWEMSCITQERGTWNGKHAGITKSCLKNIFSEDWWDVTVACLQKSLKYSGSLKSPAGTLFAFAVSGAEMPPCSLWTPGRFLGELFILWGVHQEFMKKVLEFMKRRHSRRAALLKTIYLSSATSSQTPTGQTEPVLLHTAAASQEQLERHTTCCGGHYMISESWQSLISATWSIWDSPQRRIKHEITPGIRKCDTAQISVFQPGQTPVCYLLICCLFQLYQPTPIWATTIILLWALMIFFLFVLFLWFPL